MKLLDEPIPKLVVSPVNPYKNYSKPLGFYECFKYLIIGVTLFPLRVICLFVSLFFAWLLSYISLIGLPPADKGPPTPLSQWRRVVQSPIRLCARGCLLAYGFQWITVKGKRAPRNIAPILVYNHSTFVDGFFAVAFDFPCLLSAKENMNLPFIGVVQQAMQCMFIDRENKQSGNVVMEMMRKRARDSRWPAIGVFPEGTVTNQTSLINFKMGAFAPMLPVQPVVLKFPYSRLDPSWVSIGLGTVELNLRMMLQFNNSLVAEYLPVLVPEEQDPSSFAVRVKRSMTDALGIASTEHMLGETMLVELAKKLRFPPEAAVVELGAQMGSFFPDQHTALRCCKAYVHKFAHIDRARRGALTFAEVADAVRVVYSRAAVRETARMMDTDGTGSISLRQFMVGMAHLRRLCVDRPELLSALFQACGGDSKGCLCEADVQRVIQVCIPDLDAGHVSYWFRQADSGGSGRIGFEQFRSLVVDNPELLPVLSSLPSN